MPEERIRKTVVIGHKNPDTDSICSAICYAKLKSEITGREAGGECQDPGQGYRNSGDKGSGSKYLPEKSMEFDAGC